jgi:hypothetical protein
MLRDKYTFKLGQRSLEMLNESIKMSLEQNRETTSSICALCMLSLLPFSTRLNRAVYPRKEKHSFSIKRIEAVALHLAYKNGYVISNDPLLQQIFTAIDRTL